MGVWPGIKKRRYALFPPRSAARPLKQYTAKYSLINRVHLWRGENGKAPRDDYHELLEIEYRYGASRLSYTFFTRSCSALDIL